jgi:putative endonuclease
MSKQYYVYIMTNKKRGTLYIGSTSDLEGRIWEHKTKLMNKSFTATYGLTILVYYEERSDALDMVNEERKLKKWNRKWRLDLIEKDNPNWDNLSLGWHDEN